VYFQVLYRIHQLLRNRYDVIHLGISYRLFVTHMGAFDNTDTNRNSSYSPAKLSAALFFNKTWLPCTLPRKWTPKLMPLKYKQNNERKKIHLILKTVSAVSLIPSYNVRNADSDSAVYLNTSRVRCHRMSNNVRAILQTLQCTYTN